MTTTTNHTTKQADVGRITVFDDLPDGALTDISEISALACHSRASIWRDVHEGRLTQPHKVGPNATRWYVSDVRRYLNGGE
jgi:predicted DNA-binding transcriptional regulator AlpA